MPDVRLCLLGSPRLEIDGLPVKVETRKTMALLAFLGMTGESYRRDSLVNLFWPEYDLTHGRGVLRRTLSALNDVLPVGWVRADRETIGLSPTASLWVDVNEFRRLLAERGRHPHAGEEVCPDCQGLLSQAAALYREDFMSGFSLPDSYNFDDWQFFQAEGLRQELGVALGRLAHCLVLHADFAGAIEQTRRRLALDRLNEAAQRDLMLLYAWSGQRSAALRQFQECKDALQSQLGVEPQAATTDLFHAVETGRYPAPPSEPAWLSPPKKATDPLPAPSVPASPAPDMPRPAQSLPSLALEEKRMLSVLACEISRLSSSSAEGNYPEEGAGILDQFLALAPPVLAPYGGKIERGLGGIVLIVFGLQHSRENDPELALRAALELRSAAERSDIYLSAGIASGEVYIRQEMEADKGEHHLAGGALEQAMHLASQAACGQIFVAESTYQLCRRAFEFTPLPPLSQRSGPALPIYRLENLQSLPHMARMPSPARTRLVGREKELEQLRGALASLGSGAGHMLCLSGEAGVGKSRLVEEIRAEISPVDEDQAGPLWLEGRCLELSIDTGYWPFVDLLRPLFSWQGQPNSPANEMQVVAMLESLVAGGFLASSRGAEITRLFCRLLAPSQEDCAPDELTGQSPEEIRRLTFLALRDFLIALARRQALVLVFEDLHWADRLSLDVISLLMENLEQVPILLLCVYRPDAEYRTVHLAAVAGRKCRGRFTEIHLPELSRAESFQLMDGMLGSSGFTGRIQELVWERCKGNPFFIEEILQSLIDSGAIYREDHEWKVARGFDTTQIPASIQSIILGRLDHLDEDWRLVLQTAAVIGRVFRRPILEKSLGVDLDLDKALWDLEGRGLIYQERAVPEVEFSFHHTLMQEAIYHNILRHRRKLLHQRAAEAIETLYLHSLAEQAEQLAYHYEKSGNIKQAITYLYQAGEKARAIYSNEAAITHLTKGLELLRSLPETQERNRQELDFLILLGVPLVHVRGHADPDVLAVYDDAHSLCNKTGDTAHLFEVLLGLRRYYLHHGQIRIAHDLSRQMLDLADKNQDNYEQTRAWMMMGEVFHRQGNYGEVAGALRQGLELSAGLNPHSSIRLYGNDTYLGCLAFFCPALWHLGFPDQARGEAQRLLALSEALSHPFSRELTLYMTANLYILLQDPLTVQRLAEEELHIADERGFMLYQAWGAIQLGWALALQDHVTEGLEGIEKGIEGLRQIQFALIAEAEYPLLGEVLLLAGQTERALEIINTGLEALERSGGREWEAEFLRLKAEGLYRQNRLEEAQQNYQKAIQVARRQSSRGWELRASSGLARLWLAQGRRAEARDLLQPLYSGFTEGFDTSDLRDARSLIECTV